MHWILLLFTVMLATQLAKTSAVEEIKEIDFNGVKEGLEKKTLFLIDVRTPKELKDDGRIPGSINIPMNDLVHSFTEISDEEFQTSYGFDRRSPGKPLAVTCRSGRRAKDAIDKLRSLGIKLDYLLYKGSFLDWVAKGGKVEK